MMMAQLAGLMMGFILVGLGFLYWLAAGNASAPQAAEGRKGCLAALIGLAVFGAAAWSILA
ncbi:MAG: hypothetical protein QOH47_796 [Sphingomonadales bacterium]|jgi:uncharacterized membrane protein (DUF441 family)|nr:hypothetical protein [Sphingomonadales bacterium]